MKIQRTKEYATRIHRKNNRRVYINADDVFKVISPYKTRSKDMTHNFLFYMTIEEDIYIDAISVYCLIKNTYNSEKSECYLNYLVQEKVISKSILKNFNHEDFKPIKSFMHKVKKGYNERAMEHLDDLSTFLKKYKNIERDNLLEHAKIIWEIEDALKPVEEQLVITEKETDCNQDIQDAISELELLKSDKRLKVNIVKSFGELNIKVTI